MNLFPVNLDICNRRCLIIGGGEVAARKMDALLVSGAEVTVISPWIVPRIAENVELGKIEYSSRGYQKGDLDGAFLVFAATDCPTTQQQIIVEAKQQNILLNAADEPDSCDFQVPAQVRRGDFLVTVSTGGGSPALAAQIRGDLENAFGPEYGQFVDLLARIREQVLEIGQHSNDNKALFKQILGLDILTMLRQHQFSLLEESLRAILPAKIVVSELLEKIEKT